jgi:hypothetical protein
LAARRIFLIRIGHHVEQNTGINCCQNFHLWKMILLHSVKGLT